VAHVVARVEVRVVDPLRTALPERDVGELLAVARHDVQPVVDRAYEVLVRGRLAGEDEDRRDVHVRAARFEIQERGVQAAETVAVGHARILARTRDRRRPGSGYDECRQNLQQLV
jgi:hypothetical protein